VSRFILEMPMVRELCSHFIRARNSLILSCSSGRSFYITLLVGVVERGEEENVDGERWEKLLVFNNWENGFSYFIYIVTIISI